MVLQTPNYKEIAKLFIVHYSLLSRIYSICVINNSFRTPQVMFKYQ